MTIDTSRVETGLLTRLRSIANRYRAWRITEDQMQREVRQAIADAKQEVIDLFKEAEKRKP